MKPRDHRSVPVVLLIILLAFSLAALAACGDADTAEEEAAQSAFVGTWEPVDATLDITWGGEEGRSYSLSSGDEGGSIEVVQESTAITVTLAGKGGDRTDRLPADEQGKTLTFEIPISEEMPTEATLTSTGDGLAELRFGDGDLTWEFRQAGSVTTGD